MREVAAIVESAIDLKRAAREIAAANVAVQDAERKFAADEERAEQCKEAAANSKRFADQCRLDLGRLLAETRKAWPARGPNSKGWGEFLKTVGIEEQTARNYMALAGHVEKFSKSDESDLEIPTQREVNAARRFERAGGSVEEVDSRAAEATGTVVRAVPALDIDRELSRLSDKIIEAAKSFPKKGRAQLAHELREMARVIEEME